MRRILLVDDNKAIAQELAKLLKRRGYEVQISATLAGTWVIIEAEAVRRGATLCLDKTRTNLVADKLIEYACRQSCGEPQPVFHKLLYVHADTADTSNGLRSGVLSAAMLH